ncbi:MAG: c-type cytochrome domain-containing protein [Verrucomicrobiales bacterium]
MTGHAFNVLLYLPVGLVLAAVILEVFAQWKGNRDVEPGILFLLFVSAGAAVVTPLLALAFATVGRESGELTAFCYWMGVVVAFIAAAFWLKRKCRDQKLFALTPPPHLTGKVAFPRTPIQKTVIVGYRIVLILALLAAMAGVSEMPLGNVPLKSLASAIRSVAEPSSAPPPAIARNSGADLAPSASAPIPAPAPVVPSLAELIDQRPSTASNSSGADPLVAAASRSIEGQPAPAEVSAAKDASITASANTTPPEPPEPSPAATTEPPPSPALPAKTPAPPSDSPPATTPTVARVPLDKSFFPTKIKPIIDSKCVSCHGSSKQKGDLRLDSIEAIKKGSGNPIIVPGNPDASELFTRLTSPDEDEVMPPKEKGGPLPAPQIDLFKKWILAGADFGDGSSITALSTPARPGGKVEEELSQKLPPPDAALLARLTQAGVVVRPLSANGAVLDLNFSHSDLPQVSLADLSPIAKNVYALDLTRTKLRDEALAPITQMSSLRRLQLNRNPITDAGLVHLKGLSELESLNLYETEVTDAGLDQLIGLKKLQKLFLYNTKCTSAGADKLKSQIPGVVINLGS